MFKILDITKDDVIAFLVEGKVSKADYDKLMPLLEKAQREHESLKFLVEIRGIEGLEPAAIWEDLKLYFKHVKSAEKVAIVASGTTWKALSNVSQPFIAGKIRHFDESAVLEARDWLTQDD